MFKHQHLKMFGLKLKGLAQAKIIKNGDFILAS